MRRLCNIHKIDIEPGQVGVTVRRGSKWADLRHGDQIELCVCPSPEGPHNIVGHGYVETVWTGPFNTVPASLIEYEHEESSRLYSGLLQSMRRAYGDGFEPTEFVVAFAYRRLD